MMTPIASPTITTAPIANPRIAFIALPPKDTRGNPPAPACFYGATQNQLKKSDL